MSLFSNHEEDNEREAPPASPPVTGEFIDDYQWRTPRPSRWPLICVRIAIFVAAGAVLVAAVQTYARLTYYDTQLARLNGLSDGLDAVDTRVDGVEQQLGTIPARGDSQGRNVPAGLDPAAKSTQDLKKTDARLQQLEDAQRTETTHIAEIEKNLEQQNTQLRQELSNVNGRLTAMNQTATKQAGTTQSPAFGQSQPPGNNQTAGTEEGVARPANIAGRPRTRFEAGVGHSQEIAPGILLHISGTDPGNHRFRGWIQLVGSGKIVWIRDQSMLQAVGFYAGHSLQRHDLVITGVNKSSVAGYVIFPAHGGTDSPQRTSGTGGF